MVSNSRPRKTGPEEISGRERQDVPADLVGADAVEVGQDQRIGEEDRIVEECLRRHQAQAHQGARALGAEQRVGDLAERREAARGEPDARQLSHRPSDVRAPGTLASIRATIASASSTRPWVISQRGDSGSHIRMKKMMSPSTAPMKKAMRQPISGAKQCGIEQHDRARGADCGADPEAAVDDEIGPAAIARRHQLLDGRIDGGVFAADPGAGQEPEQHEAPQIPRECGGGGGDQIDRKRDEEQPLAPEPVGEPAEEQRAQHGAGDIGAAGNPDIGIGEGSCGLSLSAGDTAPAKVTSRPSRIQVTPSATTTRVWKRPHGSRSSRAGISVSTIAGADVSTGRSIPADVLKAAMA